MSFFARRGKCRMCSNAMPSVSAALLRASFLKAALSSAALNGGTSRRTLRGSGLSVGVSLECTSARARASSPSLGRLAGISRSTGT
eukprot:5128318-Pyramimonas_sp.AAC.1